jgi:hypothetical protein
LPKLYERDSKLSREADPTSARERGVNQMKTYEVNITITSNGQARIKASSLEEAWKQANNLSINDYQMLNGNEDQIEIREITI